MTSNKIQYLMFAVAAFALGGMGVAQFADAVLVEDNLSVDDVPSGQNKSKGERSSNVCGAGGNGDTITVWVRVWNDNPDDKLQFKYDLSECTSVSDVTIDIEKNSSWVAGWSGSQTTHTVDFSSVTVGSTDDFDFFIDYTVT
ncbi:MAG: hypothetical protein K5798_01935 [Nitrosopumilus sp.]|uniref:hypothetical protein n=1 Tax=Nitrosopumilus sp. TaxID=2024843 RepID=UPI00242DEC79|nr:hypothetical protein [Nitrosopumilus sp.]MCV0366009.1 hypothetical protein [Nitrosopumilus sp.]